ncbi:hypothetical protein AgCh_038034 [Apium graveolens]
MISALKEGMGDGGGDLDHNTSSNLSLVVKALSVMVVVTGVEGKSEKRMLSLEDLYSGTTKKLTLSRNVICAKCNGQMNVFGSVVPVIVIKTQNPIIDPEINGLGDIISAVDETDVEFDDTKKRIELQPDSVHHVLGDICSTDSSSSSHNFEDTVDADVHISSDDQINMEQSSRVSKPRVSKPEDGAEVMETSSMSDDKLLDNLKKDQVHQAMHVTIHKELEITASHYICERIMIDKIYGGFGISETKRSGTK